MFDEEMDYEMSGYHDSEMDDEFDDELDDEFDGFMEDELDSEMELAAELLEISDEAELDYFFSKLIKSAKGFVKSRAGKALLGTLKGVAKSALPTAGAMLGNAIAPGIGGAIGGQLASAVASNLEMEFQDQEMDLETARQVVKLAKSAANKLPALQTQLPPKQAAQVAVKQAFKKLPASQQASRGLSNRTRSNRSIATKGRWYRRGGNIVIQGL